MRHTGLFAFQIQTWTLTCCVIVFLFLADLNQLSQLSQYVSFLEQKSTTKNIKSQLIEAAKEAEKTPSKKP